jgi:AraC family transcriptional regulator, regulatory protein of adaptative response / methylated-DNA-[protein]-cysteine methyltransferase
MKSHRLSQVARELPGATKTSQLIRKACERLKAAHGSLSLTELAQAAGLSASHFHRQFKAHTGVTPKAYAVALRSSRVRDELDASASVTEAIYSAGFNSSSRFYAASENALGMTPTEYRRAGKGVEVRFAVGLCSLGSVLVAASERGVCAILLGDDPEELVRDLQVRFAQASLVGADKEFEDWVAHVVGFIDVPGGMFKLPLDLQGTVFQVRVWQALKAIPVGSTVSYSELAERIGAPKSARAVARACATNPVAVVIPCHRVVRTDGSLSGYRWGVERKRELLTREGEHQE